jgi:hypothetical protein
MKKLLGVLLCAPLLAHASWFDYEASIGATRFSSQPDNTWYQEGAEHHLDLLSLSGSAGITGPVVTRGSWGVDWHAAYVNLGHVTSQCDCTPVDAFYSQATHSITNTSVPLANFMGSGMAQGIALTVEPYVWSHGLRFSVEAGVFPYIASFNETVTNWSGQPGVATRTLHVATPHHVEPGAVVGASVGKGRISVGYRHFILPSNSKTPAVWKGADMIEVKWRFK